jgi:hypothetical protein
MKLNRIFQLIVLVLVLVLSSNVFSQDDGEFRKKACCNFNEGLRSDIDGIVISALINVMRMYHDYPNENFDTINKNLDTLITNGSTEQIRFIAQIIKNYLQDETNLDWIMDFNNEAIQNYFILLSASNLRKIASKY